jgi:hypothetical protein
MVLWVVDSILSGENNEAGIGAGWMLKLHYICYCRMELYTGIVKD